MANVGAQFQIGTMEGCSHCVSSQSDRQTHLADRTNKSQDLLTIQGYDIAKLELEDLALTYKELNQIAGQGLLGL